MSGLAGLHSGQLRSLATAVEAGRLAFPFEADSVAQIVGTTVGPSASAALRDLARKSGAQMMGPLLDVLAEQARWHESQRPSLDLVWSGPDLPEVNSRDTASVVREAFRNASRKVLLCGYAIHSGKQIFEQLSKRMNEVPSLKVSLLLDIRPNPKKAESEAQRVSDFCREFRERHWPEGRFPFLYYDPRSFDPDPTTRASLHAKCVIIDELRVLVSSANFTPAAQQRNIEVGIVVEHAEFAARLDRHFQSLIEHEHVRAAPLHTG